MLSKIKRLFNQGSNKLPKITKYPLLPGEVMIPTGDAKMNQQQHSLLVFEEELGELTLELLKLQQLVSKAIRFGPDDTKRELEKTNKERIKSEWNDVLGSIEILKKVGIDITPNSHAIANKIAKVEKYAEYSKSLGLVHYDADIGAMCFSQKVEKCPTCGADALNRSEFWDANPDNGKQLENLFLNIKTIINQYYIALDDRKHAVNAQDMAFREIQLLMGMKYEQGVFKNYLEEKNQDE